MSHRPAAHLDRSHGGRAAFARLFFLSFLALLTWCTAGPVHAVEIGVVGLFPGKAVLVVDGAAPKTYSVGSQIGADSKLTAADDQAATFSIHGKSLVIPIGSHINPPHYTHLFRALPE